MGILNIENIVLEGRVNYPIVYKPRTDAKYGKTEYSVEVECTDEKYKELVAKGVSPNTKLRINKDDGRTYIRVKAKDKNFKGEPNTIRVEDTEGNPVTSLIGNGSKCKVAASLISLDTGMTVLQLKGLKVLDLVHYEPKERDIFDDGNVI